MDKNEYIRANYRQMTDEQLAVKLGLTAKAVEGRRKRMGLKKVAVPPVQTGYAEIAQRIIEELEKQGIEPDEFGAVRKVRYSSYQSLIKDDNNEAQVVDLNATKLEIYPNWLEGPKWPLIQPARPVKITPYKPAERAKKYQYKVGVILPDPQIGYRNYGSELDPFQDEAAIAVAMKIIRDINPDLIINLGDMLDFAEYSRFTQERAFVATVQPTLDRAHKYLAEQKQNAPRAKIVMLEGNHDRRLEKNILTNAAAAFGLRLANAPDSWPVMSVPNLLRLDELGVEYVGAYPAGQYWVNDRLVCIHGHKVRSSGSTAKAVADDERVSTIFGHVHRIELHYKTVRVRDGGRTNFAFTPGCLCRIDGATPSTKGSTDVQGRPVTNYENWQQGLAVIHYNEGDSPFAIEPIYIDHGRAIFRGKEYTA